MSYEFPLVIFTVFTQLGVGIALYSCCNGFSAVSGEEKDPAHTRAWFCAFFASFVGLLASFFHLGHPFAAYKALNNLGDSWLSREALILGCFCALALCNVFCRSKGLMLVTAIVGLMGLVAQGMTYAAPSMPTINNAFPMALFVFSALALGAFHSAVLFSPRYFAFGRPALLVLLAILLLAPTLWLSGTATMQESATLWLSSKLYWLGLILMGLAFAATFCSKVPGKLKLISLLVGIFLTRMVFFADTVHTASNLGLPFN